MLENAGTAEGVGEARGLGVAGGRRGFSRETEIMLAGMLVVAGSFIYPHVMELIGVVTPGCLFRRLTGLPCLLCGMTRSFAAAAYGHWGEAFRMHLLGPPLFLLVAALTVALAAEKALSLRLLPRPGGRSRRVAAWGFLALLAAAWIVRLVLFGVNA